MGLKWATEWFLNQNLHCPSTWHVCEICAPLIRLREENLCAFCWWHSILASPVRRVHLMAVMTCFWVF